MDRPSVYLGQVPRSLDVLSLGQDAMVGLGKLAEAVLGTATIVTGFPITATSPASLNISVGAGQVYEVENLEATQLSGLASDTHQIVKQGLTLDPTTLTLVPPTTVGFAVNVLIEVQYQDVDTGAIVLTFQNPAVPGTTFQGPGGNGQQSNTVRKGVAQIVPKYGTSATAGQQTTPTPDVGYVGVAVVTLTYGQTTITSTNVSPYNSGASYLPVTLTGVPASVLSGAWVFGTATAAGPVVPGGTTAQVTAANSYAATLFATGAYPFTLTAGMEILAYFGQANTSTSPVLNANGLGNLPILKQGGGSPSAGDISMFIPLILNPSRTAWLINGLAISDVLALITSVTRINLTANLTVYVRTDGSDSNTGLVNSAASAFATIQGAINKIFGTYNLAGYGLTVQLGITGTYAGAIIPNVGVSGTVVIQGNTAAQSSYIITPVVQTDGSYDCFNVSISTVTITGVTLNMTSVSGQGSAIYCGPGSTVGYGNITFTTSGTSTGVSLVSIKAAASTYRTGPVTVTGGGTIGTVIYVSQGGTDGGCIASTAQTFTINGMTFSNFYFVADGTASLAQTTFAGSGNTGSRYAVSLNGSIDVQGQLPTAIPGSTIGSTATGGQVPGDLGTAWTAYTPTITASSGTLTSATAAGRYQRNGKSITVQVTGVIATNGSGAGVITLSLPFTAAGADYPFAGKDTGLTNKVLSAHVNAGSAFNVEFYDGSYPGASGARLSLGGVYETSQ